MTEKIGCVQHDCDECKARLAQPEERNFCQRCGKRAADLTTIHTTTMTHTINSTNTVAVATDTYWLPIDKDTPRSVKLQLLSIGGVAQYGTLGSDPTFFTHWCPVPKKPK